MILDGYEFEYVEYDNRHYLFGNNEDVRGIVVVGRDISEARRQARETLQLIRKVEVK